MILHLPFIIKKMEWSELKLFIKDKVFLIGITIIDKNDQLIEEYQTSGTVKELTDEGIIKFIRPDNSLFQMPYDKESIRLAAPGEYREKETGQVIVNPDYITIWTYKIKDIEHLKKIKSCGYLKE